MLHEVNGDLLLTQAEVIAHGVAPGDHFNHGLALALRERWPSMAKDFRHWCHTTHPKPGDLWIWSGAGGVRIVNLLTHETVDDHQKHNSGGARLEYVNHALKSLHKLAQQEQFKSLAVPKIATGIGGLEWSAVQPLIKQHLGDLKIPVFVYTEYHKGVKAIEPLPVSTHA